MLSTTITMRLLLSFLLTLTFLFGSNDLRIATAVVTSWAAGLILLSAPAKRVPDRGVLALSFRFRESSGFWDCIGAGTKRTQILHHAERDRDD
jgi:hypothetical protein